MTAKADGATASKAGATASKAGATASKAGATASKAGAAAKAVAGKAAGTKAVLYGGSLVAFVGRRALWPGFVLGGAFGSAFWFGIFDLTLSMSRVVMPVPAKPERAATNTGYATVPVVMAGASAIGWQLSPALAAPPTSVVDLSGLFRFMTSLPLRHLGIVGASSAAAAAVTCRVVQYRGGA